MKAGTAGGIEVVAKAIDIHTNSFHVCFSGCGALWNMINNGKNTNKSKATSNEQMRTKIKQEQQEELRLL